MCQEKDSECRSQNIKVEDEDDSSTDSKSQEPLIEMVFKLDSGTDVAVVPRQSYKDMANQ